MERFSVVGRTARRALEACAAVSNIRQDGGRIAPMNAFRLYRPNFAFLFGLCAAAAVAVAVEHRSASFDPVSVLELAPAEVSDPLPLAPQSTLTAADMQAAQTAWAYFSENTQPQTGLVNAVDGFPSVTLWDFGSYLFALVSANKLGILPNSDFEDRAQRALAALARMPLYEGLLPNKAYDTQSLAMVNYQNESSERGVGWSAVDLGRLMLALKALQLHAPDMTPVIHEAVARWSFEALISDGMLFGATRDADTQEHKLVQEGRLGYEQYAARALMRSGLGATRAVSAANTVTWTEVLNVPVPDDRRSHRRFDAITTTLSEPYVLMGLELGLDDDGWQQASQVLRAMQARHADTGILTMLSEDHIDAPPYFLYGAVLGNGRAWTALAEDGSHHDALLSQSLKAAFGWEALFGGPYAGRVRAHVTRETATERGWMAGVYEAGSRPNTALALNTNAVVLEALHYKAFGPLVPPGRL
ncbi:DUF3131 domain-containing protein [Pseudoruegeria sp. SHC-113]|uniref:DUF3131 domain-containing protein n=1 Tax=Pseudoruegeria sp. SHC-113 TaxID=2855439 RepID=UPI0021BA8D12|nr:DUF3131 domain-containing protein [Pseudoruegeria sp. SHC-113]MCT8159564.1 DUF3131 domain-containing protein [Pseudoruegeria sp. SHC-113]